MMKAGWVYLMANHRRGRTYLGVTSDLPLRAWQNRSGVSNGHSKAKGCIRLVWHERFDDLQDARACEFRMKKWKRAWKLRLIEQGNLIGTTYIPTSTHDANAPAFAGARKKVC